MTDPEKIYLGDEGFDIKFSQAGMWGRALYFAEHSNYSDKFAYNFENGDKGMFLALVNLGKEIEIEFDENFTR